jgi:uncharacterized protein YlbG (UPF0298 family)
MGNAFNQEEFPLENAHKKILLLLIEVRQKLPLKYFNNTRIRPCYVQILQKMMDLKYIMMVQTSIFKELTLSMTSATLLFRNANQTRKFSSSYKIFR